MPDHNQGLVPPALLKCGYAALDPEDSCSQRPILLSFVGKRMRSSARLELEKLSNDRDVLVGGYEKIPMWMNLTANEFAPAFSKLASLSTFGAAPRGE